MVVFRSSGEKEASPLGEANKFDGTLAFKLGVPFRVVGEVRSWAQPYG